MAARVTDQSRDSRSLVFSEGSSDKFWKIELDGSSHTVTFGRVGTAGQTQTKDFASDAEARKAFDKLVAEKTKKGYIDAGGSAATGQSNAMPAKAAASTSKANVQASADRTADKTAKSTAKKKAKADEDAAPADAGPPGSAAPHDEADLRVTHEIDLDPGDWFRAGFRRRPPLDRGTPAEFDLDDCVNRLSKLKTTSYGWDTRWEDLHLPPALSRQEAHFWLVAMTTPRPRETSPAELAESLRNKKFDGQLDEDDIVKLLVRAERRVEHAPQPVASLLTAEKYVDLVMSKPSGHKQRWDNTLLQKALVDGFNRYVLPYVTDAQRDAFRKKIRKEWDPHQETANYDDRLAPEYYLAASLGMHEEVYQVTSHWSDDHFQKLPYAEFYQRPQELLFGLGSAEIVAAEWRRLKLKMQTTEDVRGFLACTEFSALDCVTEEVLRQTNKDECESFLKVLALVRAPQAALPMLQCKLAAKMPQPARAWLDKYVGNAVAGLIDVAAGRGSLAEGAIEYLRSVKQRGHAAVIAEAVRQAGQSDGAARVQAEVLDHAETVYSPLDAKSTPKPLAKELEALGSLKKKPLPSWASTAVLPPLVVGDKRLSDEQVGSVLQVLVATPVGKKHSLFTALRENVSKQSRDDFAWKLFRAWQDDGFPSKDKWAMGSIGHLGDDGCVLKLTPLIRIWPGESQHQRAVFGLECLRAIGSSVALMNLSGIAQKLKFKGLKSKAEQFVTEIAKERGLTRDELEDRVVPDCGLDEHGKREFSFGPRSFSFVLGGDLKAMVRDSAGKLRPNLPDPTAKDDEAKAAESLAEWKILKKQIKDVATIQASRLEQSMVTGRRWKAEDFETLLVRHPLMTHLAQKLIWGGFDSKGKRQLTFRVTEERDYADPDDASLKLKGVETVGIVHPLEMTDAERARWGEVLGDYEIVAPFPQLGRPVHGLEAGEGKEDDLKRFHGLKLVAPTLVFTLEKLGWIRGEAMDAGGFDEHSKQFPAADVTAVVGYEGTVGMGYIDPNELLTLESIHFCAGMRAPSGYGWGSKQKLTLEQVPPIVISEVIADLHVLKSKAK